MTIGSNMGESHRRVERKKPDQREHILCDPPSYQIQKQVKLTYSDGSQGAGLRLQGWVKGSGGALAVRGWGEWCPGCFLDFPVWDASRL